MSVPQKPKPFTVEDLNRLESERSQVGPGVTSMEIDGLLDLAISFRNALREIQVSGNPQARDLASRALNHGRQR